MYSLFKKTKNFFFHTNVILLFFYMLYEKKNQFIKYKVDVLKKSPSEYMLFFT